MFLFRLCSEWNEQKPDIATTTNCVFVTYSIGGGSASAFDAQLFIIIRN